MTLRLLTWNIFWESMDTKKINCYDTNLTPNGNTKCLENVAQFLDESDYGFPSKKADFDFICLQEAVNWEKIRDKSTKLKDATKYGYIGFNYRRNKYIDGKTITDSIVTFYSTNHKLDTSANQILGHMVDTGRPFLINFFDKNLCIINIHVGHHNDHLQFDGHLENWINKYIVDKNHLLTKLRTYNIIMMGDFNDALVGGFVILKSPFFGIPRGRTLYGQTPNGTMTILTNGWTSDHILYTFAPNSGNTRIIPSTSYLQYSSSKRPQASDHLPVLLELHIPPTAPVAPVAPPTAPPLPKKTPPKAPPLPKKTPPTKTPPKKTPPKKVPTLPPKTPLTPPLSSPFKVSPVLKFNLPTTTKSLSNNLDELDKTISKITDYRDVHNIEKAQNLILEIINKNGYKIEKNTYNYLFRELDRLSSIMEKNPAYKNIYMSYADKINYDLVNLMRNDLNQNNIPEPVRNSEMVQFQVNTLTNIVNYMDIINDIPYLKNMFNEILQNNSLDLFDIEIYENYVKNGMNSDVALIITLFYSILKKSISLLS